MRALNLWSGMCKCIRFIFIPVRCMWLQAVQQAHICVHILAVSLHPCYLSKYSETYIQSCAKNISNHTVTHTHRGFFPHSVPGKDSSCVEPISEVNSLGSLCQLLLFSLSLTLSLWICACLSLTSQHICFSLLLFLFFFTLPCHSPSLSAGAEGGGV